MGSLVMSFAVFATEDLATVQIAGFFMGVFGYLATPAVNVMIFDVVPPETRSSALAADGVILSAFSALASFSIGAVSHYVGIRQGLAEGNLHAGFQGTATVFLIGAVIVSLALLRTSPGDMRALREYVGQRTSGS